jgi:endonuclease/exonuclease/phosphatase family metal-dependent hydrolase
MIYDYYIGIKVKKFTVSALFFNFFPFFALGLNLGCFSGCTRLAIDQPADHPSQMHITRYGSEDRFDLVTWNIKDFPIHEEKTVSTLARIIKEIDVDLIGLQEINDPLAFHELLDSLPGYTGLLSALPADDLKLGILCKSSMIALSTPLQIFTDDNFAFPRPPLVTFAEVRIQDSTVFDFFLIVLHLKAQSDGTSIQRRRLACQKLKSYIDDNLLTGVENDVIVLGDLNDQLDDPDSLNVFTVFQSDSAHYFFLTGALLDQASYIEGYQSLIDHILVSTDTRKKFDGGKIQILKLDLEVPGYLNLISDHRPVHAQFPVPSDGLIWKLIFSW